MRTPARMGAFAAILGVTFGAAALAGASMEPLREVGAGHGHSEPAADAHGGGDAAGLAREPAGLAVAREGYSLVYRACADFSTAGRPMTLAADLFVAGPFRPVPVPAPSAVDATADRYRAELSASELGAGTTIELGYALSRSGRPLEGVEPYLGADGHLVALREGDLAFLHAHPEESDTPGTIRFGAALPSPGRYRLFLQFKHEGRVRTVAHTLEASP